MPTSSIKKRCSTCARSQAGEILTLCFGCRAACCMHKVSGSPPFCADCSKTRLLQAIYGDPAKLRAELLKLAREWKRKGALPARKMAVWTSMLGRLAKLEALDWRQLARDIKAAVDAEQASGGAL